MIRIWVLLILCVAAASGCGDPRLTDTSKSGVERLLVTTAIDRAVAELQVESLREKKIFIDMEQFDADKPDMGYLLGVVGNRLGQAGALVVSDPGAADLIVQPYVGVMDTDSSKFLIGIPGIPVVIPGAGTVTTPELAIWRKTRQVGTAKLGLNVFDPGTGKAHLVKGPQHGVAYFTRYTVLFIFSWNSTDILEAKKTSY